MLARTFLVALTVACCLLGQDGLQKTRGFWNGRMWTTLPLPAKALYIQGLKDGQVLAGAALQGKISKQSQNELDTHAPVGFIVGDYIKAFDDLYKEPSNIRIPMMYAYEYCIGKFKGHSDSQLAEVLRSFREWSAQK